MKDFLEDIYYRFKDMIKSKKTRRIERLTKTLESIYDWTNDETSRRVALRVLKDEMPERFVEQK